MAENEDLTPSERVLVEEWLSFWQKSVRDAGYLDAIPEAEIGRNRAELEEKMRSMRRGGAVGGAGASSASKPGAWHAPCAL
jgi:hypothetical protein